MMRTTQSPRISNRDRRALRVGLRLAAPALVYALLVKPYVASTRRVATQLQTQADLLAREEALVADAPSVPRRISALRVAADIAYRRLYAADDPITATAALSRDVAATFAEAGLSLRRVETREPTLRPDGLRELAIDTRADGDFAGVLSALVSLESGDHLIRITRMAIDASAQQQLTIIATIRGYMP